MIATLAILAVLLGALFHAGANILDSYFSNTVFKRLANLVFFSALFNVFFLPIVFFVSKPTSINPHLLLVVFIIALIEVLYQYPYYWSFQHADTSVVTSLFSLGDIVTPLFAFLIVKEHLQTVQYIGFFIIILSSVLLTIDIKKIKLNRALFLMLLVSIILTLQTVLWKYLFEHGTGWGTAIVWKTLLEFFIAALFLIVPKNYNEFKGAYRKAKDIGWLFVFNNFLSWGGEAIGLFGLYILPVTVNKGISSIQPLFVLLLAFLFARKLPRMFKEQIGKDTIWKKTLLFVVMTIGIVLTVR